MEQEKENRKFNFKYTIEMNSALFSMFDPMSRFSTS